MFRYLFGSSTTFLTMSISLISLQISKLSRIVMVGRTRCQIWRSKGQLKSPVLDKFLSWHRIKLTALYNSSTLMSPNSLFTIVNRMFKTECSMTLSIFKSGTFFEEIRSWKIKSKQNSDFDKIAGKFENPHFSSRFFFYNLFSLFSLYSQKNENTCDTLKNTCKAFDNRENRPITLVLKLWLKNTWTRSSKAFGSIEILWKKWFGQQVSVSYIFQFIFYT